MMKNFIKVLIKQQYCPYCEQPISDNTLINEPNKFLTTKKVKSFCPHCYGQVEKTVLIKMLILGSLVMLLIAFAQGYLRNYQILGDKWISLLINGFLY